MVSSKAWKLLFFPFYNVIFSKIFMHFAAIL